MVPCHVSFVCNGVISIEKGPFMVTELGENRFFLFHTTSITGFNSTFFPLCQTRITNHIVFPPSSNLYAEALTPPMWLHMDIGPLQLSCIPSNVLFLLSKNVINKFLLFKPPSLCYSSFRGLMQTLYKKWKLTVGWEQTESCMLETPRATASRVSMLACHWPSF